MMMIHIGIEVHHLASTSHTLHKNFYDIFEKRYYLIAHCHQIPKGNLSTQKARHGTPIYFARITSIKLNCNKHSKGLGCHRFTDG